MKKIAFVLLILFSSLLFAGDTPSLQKADYYDFIVAPDKGRIPERLQKTTSYSDRKRSVLDKGNMVLRLSNAAIYGYDRWGLNHEFPAGSMVKDGCCTYYWTQAPMVGALINGLPSVSVGVRGTMRDHEEEFEPLPGYDSGLYDTENNIGIAFSDKPESWPGFWPIEEDPTGTFQSIITNADGSQDTLYFPGVEPELGPDGFPDAPCGLGVQADREAYFVVTDNDPLEGNTFESNTGVGPLNVRIDVWILNYASTFGNDGLIFIQKMTNVGKDTLKDLYIGIAGDPDTPEQGGQEWTDDLAMLITEDDPHIAEKLVDTTDSYLLSNFALVWDSDDKSEGFKSSGIGWIGLKFLECTKYNSDGTDSSYNVSAFYTFEYSQDAQNDAQAYNEQLLAGIQTPHNINPYSGDVFQKPYSYGPDITWVIASGPMDVAPGEQVTFTFADFMGINEQDLIRNAKLFQSLYNNNCATPRPPEPPMVRAVAEEGRVTLFWDDRSESSIDPVTGTNMFQGYRVYRSLDRGNSWGQVITDLNGDPTDVYQPLAIYDLIDNISGAYAMTDPLIYYNLGSESGLKYSYIDENVVNGYEYWYAVTAYDGPDTWAGAPVDPLENSKAKNAFIEGDNTVAVIPMSRPAGYDAGTFTITHTAGESDATLTAIAADPFAYEFLGDSLAPADFISKGHEYEVIIDSTMIGDSVVTYWTMTDLTSGTVVVNQESDITSGSLRHVVDGFIPLFENASWTVETYDSTAIIEDTDTSTSIYLSGINPSSTDGTWAGFIENLPVDSPAGRPETERLQRDLEFRFTSTGSIGLYFNATLTQTDTILLPFELWSAEENHQINCAVYMVAGTKPIYTLAEGSTNSYAFIKNVYFMPIYEDYTTNITYFTSFDYAADAHKLGWMMQFNKDLTQFEAGNIFRVFFPNPLRPGVDVYRITTTAENYAVESGDLEQILVVPNPYKVTSAYEHIAFIRELQFTRLPENCLIRIYNTAGELVQILKHDKDSPGYRGPSIEAWDLRTYNNQEVAFGVYVFHVVAGGLKNGQEYIGKFAVIK